MKKIKQTRPATWLAGGTVALSASAADAALVKVDLNHDLTTTLDNVDFGFGLGIDAGQWESGSVRSSFFTFGRLAQFNALNGSVINIAFATGGAGTYRAGAGSNVFGGVRNTSPLALGGHTIFGLVAWNLLDGTEGWLHVTAASNPVAIASITADYFAFDDDFIGVAGGRAAGNLTHGGDSEAFAGAANFTGTGVPEPSSLALLALGAAGVVGRRNRKATAA